MRKTLVFIIVTFASVVCSAVASAQNDAQSAAAQAAKAISEAPAVPVEKPRPQYWFHSLMTNINFSQTALTNWVAGGYNNSTLAANIDANANYAKDKLKWTNRLQLDYGFLYSEDKPILQKNKDRIYFESRASFATPVKHLSYSASFDFKTQFDNNYTYGTPQSDGEKEPTTRDWLNARVLKSGFFAPAYINLGLGIDWTPYKWLSVNLAPVTGGVVVVSIPELRPTYKMDDAVLFQFGSQLKADAKFVINDNFSYTTQAVFFTDYLDHPFSKVRVAWDNKVFWKLAKFFALTFATNMIYDPNITIPEKGTDGIQFKEFVEFGFSYSIATKKKS